MLQIEGVSICYGSRIALQEISLQIPRGETHGIAGLNGAGKTTLLNGIYGFKSLSAGKIQWNQSPLESWQTAYLESANYFYPGITGEEYLSLFSGDKNQLALWNEVNKLPLKQGVDSYSAGMKKRLALLGVLLLNKPLVLLDEPFNALDMEGVEMLRIVLSCLKEKGITVVITSHILETLTTSCDAIHLLESGKVETSYAKSSFSVLAERIKTQAGKQWDTQIRQLINQSQQS